MAILFMAASLCPLFCGASSQDVLTLTQEHRSSWVAEQGVVMAGSWEALPIRARIFGPHPYAPTAEQQAAYEVEHGPATIARLKELGVNFVMIHCYRGAGHKTEGASMEDAARFAKRYREAGLRVGVYASSGTLFWEPFLRRTAAVRGLARADSRRQTDPVWGADVSLLLERWLNRWPSISDCPTRDASFDKRSDAERIHRPEAAGRGWGHRIATGTAAHRADSDRRFRRKSYGHRRFRALLACTAACTDP
jgi:hypothetical protein